MKDMKDFNFGQRIKELLDERGLPLSDFLQKTETPNQRFYDWCNKGSMPSVLKALTVCEYFNMSVEKFVYGADSDKVAEYAESLQRKINAIRDLIS